MLRSISKLKKKSVVFSNPMIRLFDQNQPSDIIGDEYKGFYRPHDLIIDGSELNESADDEYESGESDDADAAFPPLKDPSESWIQRDILFTHARAYFNSEDSEPKERSDDSEYDSENSDDSFSEFCEFAEKLDAQINASEENMFDDSQSLETDLSGSDADESGEDDSEDTDDNAIQAQPKKIIIPYQYHQPNSFYITNKEIAQSLTPLIDHASNPMVTQSYLAALSIKNTIDVGAINCYARYNNLRLITRSINSFNQRIIYNRVNAVQSLTIIISHDGASLMLSPIDAVANYSREPGPFCDVAPNHRSEKLLRVERDVTPSFKPRDLGVVNMRKQVPIDLSEMAPKHEKRRRNSDEVEVISIPNEKISAAAAASVVEDVPLVLDRSTDKKKSESMSKKLRVHADAEEIKDVSPKLIIKTAEQLAKIDLANLSLKDITDLSADMNPEDPMKQILNQLDKLLASKNSINTFVPAPRPFLKKYEIGQIRRPVAIHAISAANLPSSHPFFLHIPARPSIPSQDLTSEEPRTAFKRPEQHSASASASAEEEARSRSPFLG